MYRDWILAQRRNVFGVDKDSKMGTIEEEQDKILRTAWRVADLVEGDWSHIEAGASEELAEAVQAWREVRGFQDR